MIVLAGGIGSGKSVVARILRLKGYGVFDCDFEAKRLMHHDPELRKAITRIAGREAYDREGELDRRFLASRIFGDQDIRREINSVVHQAVKKEVMDWLQRDKMNIFVETAIASESGLADAASQIWFVNASAEQRISRVKARDGRSEAEIIRIIEVQKREETVLLDGSRKVVRIQNDSGDSLLCRIDLLCKSLETEQKLPTKTHKI